MVAHGGQRVVLRVRAPGPGWSLTEQLLETSAAYRAGLIGERFSDQQTSRPGGLWKASGVPRVRGDGTS